MAAALSLVNMRTPVRSRPSSHDGSSCQHCRFREALGGTDNLAVSVPVDTYGHVLEEAVHERFRYTLIAESVGMLPGERSVASFLTAS